MEWCPVCLFVCFVVGFSLGFVFAISLQLQERRGRRRGEKMRRTRRVGLLMMGFFQPSSSSFFFGWCHDVGKNFCCLFQEKQLPWWCKCCRWWLWRFFVFGEPCKERESSCLVMDWFCSSCVFWGLCVFVCFVVAAFFQIITLYWSWGFVSWLDLEGCYVLLGGGWGGGFVW